MLVLARKVEDSEFVEWTGRYLDTPKFKTIYRVEVLVYSSDDSEKAKAKQFAAQEGYKLFVLPDSDDVLKIARQRVLAN